MSNPTSVTLLQIRTQARQLADMVNGSFVSDAEFNSYINQSYYELYDLLVQKYGDDYFVTTPYTFTTTGLTQLIALPEDFYKSLGLDLSLSGSGSSASWITINPFMFAERNKYTLPGYFVALYGYINVSYRINGSNIMLIPTPVSGLNFRMWYVPKLTALANDASTMDGISGWEEYIIVDAAIKAKQKEESDVSVLMAMKQGLIARIEAAAENRDIGAPQTVSDNRRNNGGFDGFGWGA